MLCQQFGSKRLTPEVVSSRLFALRVGVKTATPTLVQHVGPQTTHVMHVWCCCPHAWKQRIAYSFPN